MSADNQPIRGFAVLTSGGGNAPVGRVFVVNATVAGNVTVTMRDGSSHVIAVPVGYSAYPYAVVAITATTATATYANGL